VLTIIGILVILACILGPGVNRARAKVWTGTCQYRLGRAAAALRMYVDDHDGFFPPYDRWDQVIVQTVPTGPPLSCPAVSSLDGVPFSQWLLGNRIRGYALNARLVGFPIDDSHSVLNLARVRFPAATISLCDAKVQLGLRDRPDVGTGLIEGLEEGGRRHLGGANYAFLDGHVRWYRPEAVEGNDRSGRSDGFRPSFKPY
jgi:prepilin-type processing-associated H-X9-DG protein